AVALVVIVVIGVPLAVGARDRARVRVHRDGDDHAVTDGHAPRERRDGDRRPRGLVPVRPEILQPADGAIVDVGGAACARPRAGLGGVADPGRGATPDVWGQKGVGRAGGARARAGLGHVARAGRSAAHGAPVPHGVLAGHVGAVALIQGAGVRVRRTGAPRRLLGVHRAGGAGPRAALGEVALARRGSAHGAPVPRRVLAGHVGAVALIQGAGVRVGRAGDAGRLLDVRRAGG